MVLVSAVVLFAFRSLPVSKIWNKYSVMYVSASVDEETVLSYLKNAGCYNVISLSNQQAPISSPYVKYGNTAQDSYLENRLMYFKDRNSLYNLYYVPENQQKDVQRAVKNIIKQLKVPAGLDGKSHFPAAVPLIVLGVYAALGLMARHKGAFFASGLFLLLLPLVMPFYVVSAGCCLLYLALFLQNILWGRREEYKATFRSISIDVLIFSALALFFGQSLVCGFMGLISFVCTIALFLVSKSLYRKIEAARPFSFLLIFSARQIRVMGAKNLRCTAGMTIPLLIILVLFVISLNTTVSTDAKGISIPAPVTAPDSGKTLPVLADYYAWAWNTMTFPYRKFPSSGSKSPSAGDSIRIPRYVQTDSGIQEKDELVFEYNHDFTDKIKKGINNLNYPAIEKLMAAQDDQIQVAYSDASLEGSRRQKRPGLTVILLILALLEPPVLFAVYFIGRRKI